MTTTEQKIAQKKKYAQNIIKFKIDNGVIVLPSQSEVEPQELNTGATTDMQINVTGVEDSLIPNSIIAVCEITLLQVDTFIARLEIDYNSHPVLYKMLTDLKTLTNE